MFLIYIDEELVEHAGAFETFEEAEEFAQDHLTGHGIPEYEIIEAE